jgi:hypothetical protein
MECFSFLLSMSVAFQKARALQAQLNCISCKSLSNLMIAHASMHGHGHCTAWSPFVAFSPTFMQLSSNPYLPPSFYHPLGQTFKKLEPYIQYNSSIVTSDQSIKSIDQGTGWYTYLTTLFRFRSGFRFRSRYWFRFSCPWLMHLVWVHRFSSSHST